MTDGGVLSSRLVIDSMGNFSPIVKQARFFIYLFITAHVAMWKFQLNVKYFTYMIIFMQINTEGLMNVTVKITFWMQNSP